MRISVRDVTILARTARSTKVRTRREAWYLLKLTDERLRAQAKGELTIDPEVRLTEGKIVDLLWQVRKAAKAQWAAASAAEAAPAAPAGVPACVECSSEDVEVLDGRVHCHLCGAIDGAVAA